MGFGSICNFRDPRGSWYISPMNKGALLYIRNFSKKEMYIDFFKVGMCVCVQINFHRSKLQLQIQ